MIEGGPVESTALAPPLCVDLDGTLIAGDMLWESLFRGLRQRPWDAIRSVGWICRGRACLKANLARHLEFDPTTLPYRPEVLEFLREVKATGRTLVLATASDERIARIIADHLGVFDEVVASNGLFNCKGAAKLQALRERYPEGFDYMGDSCADLPLWREAKASYLVAPAGSVLRRAKAVCQPTRVFEADGGTGSATLKAAVKVLRPHQWVKNVLIFLPLLLAHELHDGHKWLMAGLAFIAFCLCASSVYVLNDLLDVEADRHHRTKRNRPFASGRLPLVYGPPLVLLLLGSSAAISLLLPRLFALTLTLYFGLTLGYSLYWKTRLLVDVMLLGGLYTLRLLVGGTASRVIVSPWLLAFSIFLFVSLAFVKRYTELVQVELAAGKGIKGRGYLIEDLAVIESVGPASGYMAVLVLALYINSDVVQKFYPSWMLLWLLCPLLMYWITRVWFFARRRYLHDDPILFAVKDRVSWYVVLLAGLLTVLASVRWNL